MANADKISQDALDIISGQIAARVPYLIEQKLLPQAASIKVGDSFPLWRLGGDAIVVKRRTLPDLLKLATRTDRWHHQVTFDGKDLAYARSVPLKKQPLREIFVSRLAGSIHQAVRLVEARAKKDTLIRLLSVPAYQVVALWLINESKGASQILVIDAPPKFAERTREKFLSSEDFLELLRKEQPVMGVKPA